MNRRWFLGASLAAVGSVFVPQYGGWYRQGSGLLVPTPIPEEPVGVLMTFSELFLRTENGYTVHRKDGDGEWKRLPDVVVDEWPPQGIE